MSLLLRQGARGTSLLCRTMAVIAFNPPTSKAESFLIIASNLNLIHYIAVVLVLYVYTFGIVFSLRPKHPRRLLCSHTTARSCCTIPLELPWTANEGRESQRFEGNSRDGNVRLARSLFFSFSSSITYRLPLLI